MKTLFGCSPASVTATHSCHRSFSHAAGQMDRVKRKSAFEHAQGVQI